MNVFKRVLIVILVLIILVFIGLRINTKTASEKNRLEEEEMIAELKDFSDKINTAIIEYRALGKSLDDLINLFNKERDELLISPSFERKEALPQAKEVL